MNRILENMLKKKEPPTLFCEVVKPLPGEYRYQVRDSQERLMTVDAAQEWKIGAGVRVSQGRIVGGAAKVRQPKEYEV